MPSQEARRPAPGCCKCWRRPQGGGSRSGQQDGPHRVGVAGQGSGGAAWKASGGHDGERHGLPAHAASRLTVHRRRGAKGQTVETANGRTGEQDTPRAARASRCRPRVWGLFGETHLGQRSCSRVEGRTHDRTRSVSQIKQNPWRSRGRSLIVPSLSTASCLLLLLSPYGGHGSLRGRHGGARHGAAICLRPGQAGPLHGNRPRPGAPGGDPGLPQGRGALGDGRPRRDGHVPVGAAREQGHQPCAPASSTARRTCRACCGTRRRASWTRHTWRRTVSRWRTRRAATTCSSTRRTGACAQYSCLDPHRTGTLAHRPPSEARQHRQNMCCCPRLSRVSHPATASKWPTHQHRTPPDHGVAQITA